MMPSKIDTLDSSNAHSPASIDVLRASTLPGPNPSSKKFLVVGNHSLSALYRLATKSTPSLRTPQNRLSMSTASILSNDSTKATSITPPSPPYSGPARLSAMLTVRRQRTTSSLCEPPLSSNPQTLSGRCKESVWDALVSSDHVRKIHLLPSDASSDLLDGTSCHSSVRHRARPCKSLSQPPQIPPIDSLPPLILPRPRPVAHPNDIDNIVKSHHSPSPGLFSCVEGPSLPTSIENLSQPQLEYYIKQFKRYAQYLDKLIQETEQKYAIAVGPIRAQHDSCLAEINDLQTELYDVRGITPAEVQTMPLASASDEGVNSSQQGLGQHIDVILPNLRRAVLPAGVSPIENQP